MGNKKTLPTLQYFLTAKLKLADSMETLKVRAVATNLPDTATLRLTESEIKTIKQTVQALDCHAKIHLFGSRVSSKNSIKCDLHLM